MTAHKKYLIINADDFAYTPGVTYGIIEAYKKGIVTSTTALTVSDFFEEAMEIRNLLAPNLPVGVHLTLSLRGFSPLLDREDVPTLVNTEGTFHTQYELESLVDLNEVYREWDAQIARFYQLGYTPDHIDSHHYVHGKNEQLFEIAVQLCEKYKLPMRNVSPTLGSIDSPVDYGNIKSPDTILASFYAREVTKEKLLSIIDQVGASQAGTITEMNCHPAFIDPELQKYSSYVDERVTEYALLTAPDMFEEIKKRGIELTDFSVFHED